MLYNKHLNEEKKVKYFYPAVDSSKQIQKQVNEAVNMTESRRKELAKARNQPLKGWRKQTGIGSIPEYNTYLEIERELEKQIKRFKSEKEQGIIKGNYHYLFGDFDRLQRNLWMIQELLKEYRYQRDNPRLYYATFKKKRDENKKGGKKKKEKK